MAKKEIKLNDLDGVNGGAVPVVTNGNEPVNTDPNNANPNMRPSKFNLVTPNDKKVKNLNVDRSVKK